jgi:sec-independent protein translocase protein TatA
MLGLESPWHLLLLAIIVLLLFGNRLPSVMRSLGQGVVEFKKGLQGIEDDAKSSAKKIEEEPSKQVSERKEDGKASQVESAQR